MRFPDEDAPPMKHLTIAVGLLLGLGACSNKFDKALSEFESYKDKMCACKDKDCAEKVDKDFKEFMMSLREKFDKDSKPSEDQDKKGKELDKAYRECKRNAKNGGEDKKDGDKKEDTK
jgi:hypothetical protein